MKGESSPGNEHRARRNALDVADAKALARGYELNVRARHSWFARPLKLFSQELLALLSAALTAVVLLLIVNVLLVAFHFVTALYDLPY